jgi:hypothetical protein
MLPVCTYGGRVFDRLRTVWRVIWAALPPSGTMELKRIGEK